MRTQNFISIIYRLLLFQVFFYWMCIGAFAQRSTPIIKASSLDAIIEDGSNVKVNWRLEPNLKPDIYYVNIPRQNSQVKLITDLEEISIDTQFGNTYDVIVVYDEMDSCLVRIAAIDAPTRFKLSPITYPQTIPFTMVDSRIYFNGKLNGNKDVKIQFDLGAGTSVVNSAFSQTLMLTFSEKVMVTNSQGTNEARTSINNELRIGDLTWTGVPLTEVGNMQSYEDLIIGNGLFRGKIIEIDYDNLILIVHDKLPNTEKSFSKHPVFFEQDRPKFQAEFTHNGKIYPFWFLFDTGRNGTMLIGEDFTSQGNNWANLTELQIINGRKIVRLDATIAGISFKDIVTNAADPSTPTGRTTLFGNQLLNQFNFILDNARGVLYLKPNKRLGQSYSDYASYLKEMAKLRNETTSN